MQSVSSVGTLSVPWSAVDARLAMPAALGVAGIPALVITDGTGKVLTANGRNHLAADPLGFVSIFDIVHRKISLYYFNTNIPHTN